VPPNVGGTIAGTFASVPSSDDPARIKGMRDNRTPGERDLLLAGLFELRIAHAEYALQAADIEALVLKLGGDPEAVFFGAYEDTLGAAPVPDYPADETDEG
jgi:hypothetical protein